MSDDELTPELRKALGQLDAEAQAASHRLDVTRVSATVLNRLKAEPHARTLVRLPAWRAAAVVALLIGGAVVLNRGDQPRGLPVVIDDSVSTADSQAVLLAVEAANDSTATAVNGVTMDDLSEQELRALLQALENEETL